MHVDSSAWRGASGTYSDFVGSHYLGYHVPCPAAVGQCAVMVLQLPAGDGAVPVLSGELMEVWMLIRIHVLDPVLYPTAVGYHDPGA